MEYYTAAEKEDKALQGLPKNLQATLKEGKMKVFVTRSVRLCDPMDRGAWRATVHVAAESWT